MAFAAEDRPSASDEDVWARAVAQERILITHDKADFGFILRKHGAEAPPGVVLIRQKAPRPQVIVEQVSRLFDDGALSLPGLFTIVMPDGRIRQSPLPDPNPSR